MSIKIGTGEAAEITTREAAVLDELVGYSVTAGRFGEGVWYVTPWLDGPSTWKVFAPVRRGELDRTRALAGAVELCRAVADFHSEGWVHGDLQPQHGLHTGSGVRLIDFAWSRKRGTTPWTAFDGTMLHLTAPELAARIAVGPQPVKTTQAADVYALAGTVWTCVTGSWPLDYDKAGISPRELGVTGLREAIAARRVPLVPAAVWPELQTVLSQALLAASRDRPSAGELAGLVAAVSA
ncbi:hypothetical protein [Kitasatospora sp. NPDC093806]|uniref:protein kinase domain-containing protein n=1 Tax=Kitasatospora sp. NPDC093806 TaxID=3155075 RepID=UPI00342D5F7E